MYMNIDKGGLLKRKILAQVSEFDDDSIIKLFYDLMNARVNPAFCYHKSKKSRRGEVSKAKQV